jgi:hypothetical protein
MNANYKFQCKTSNIIHTEHSKYNSITLCGKKWGYYFPEDTTDGLKKCKICQKILSKKLKAVKKSFEIMEDQLKEQK